MTKMRRSALLRGRYALIAAVAAFVGVASACSTSVAPKNIDGLASALGKASGAMVKADDIRWEPSRGWLSDLLVGRFVLFLGSEQARAPRDVYRARVRLSPEGTPIDVASWYNLTSTPLGDDHALVVRGSRAAFATSAFGQEQSVTCLDLDGEGVQNVTRKLGDRAMAWMTNLQRTGSGEGIGRIDVTLDDPAERVGLALAEKSLDVVVADNASRDDKTRRLRLDLANGDVVSDGAGVHVEAGQHLPKRLVFWAVDTVRAISWIGAEPIAWLEEKTFALRDTLKQAAFKVTSSGEALAGQAPEGAPANAPGVLDASQASADLDSWPPPPIRSMWKTPEPGEGEWEVPSQPWLKKLPPMVDGELPPSGFFRTFVRTDEQRPYSRVLLVAMDMRQFDLHIEGGSEDPKPLIGPPGAGRIPRDPAVLTRVAAAFNGGFKTEHGSWGMVLKKRVLLPPVPGAATVIMTKDARVGMGSWGTNKDVGGIVGIENADILSLRQNLDPLVDGDHVNPLGRAQWGFTLPGTSMQTERSGLCITNAGHLIYAWGDDLNAITLGKAMKLAGCIYGMHLDMNPHHTGFLFTNITELRNRKYNSELLSTKMEIDNARYIEYAPKDFFYLTLHDSTPPLLEGSPWEADPGVQPAPAWAPGLWRTKAASLDVLEIEPGRASFRVRPGTKENANDLAPHHHELLPDDAHRVLFALSLGVSQKHARGLVTDGRILLPMSGLGRMGVLAASDDGKLSITAAPEPGAAIAQHADMVEVPMLVEDGKEVAALPYEKDGKDGKAHAALGLSPEGRVVIVRATVPTNTSELAGTLIRAGCTQAVVLDRGAGSPGVLSRAGAANPPRSRYEDTTLYAMGKPLLPRGFRFEVAHPVPPPAPKKK
jgi:hypothetical protein